MMNILIFLVAISAISGLVVSIWTLIDTRKKYYENFITKREKRKND